MEKKYCPYCGELLEECDCAEFRAWERGGVPDTYAEIEYPDMETAEAIDGAKFDDMNYLRYRER